MGDVTSFEEKGAEKRSKAQRVSRGEKS